MSDLTVAPITLRMANRFVARYHRHHPPVRGQKYAVAAVAGGRVVGVAIAGRPVSRHLDAAGWLEVLRVATDGTRNACSLLYGASARVGAAMGYRRHQIITYTLGDEPGTSLLAAGWWCEGSFGGGSWDRLDRPRDDDSPTDEKLRWRAARPPAVEVSGDGRRGSIRQAPA